MAYDIETAYEIGREAERLNRAALARTLTNNPAQGVIDALDLQAANTVALLGGVVPGETSVLVSTSDTITVIAGDGTPTFGVAVVADGVLTVHLPSQE